MPDILRALPQISMEDRTLVTTGAVGSAVAAICCATPIVAIVLGMLGLAAWLWIADYVVIPLLLVCLALLGVGLYRQRLHQG